MDTTKNKHNIDKEDNNLYPFEKAYKNVKKNELRNRNILIVLIVVLFGVLLFSVLSLISEM